MFKLSKDTASLHRRVWISLWAPIRWKADLIETGYFAFIALFFPSQGVEGVGQDYFFLQGFPYTTVRALVPRATRYRV